VAVVPERDVAVHVNTGYKVVFEANYEEIFFLDVSTCLNIFTTGHSPVPEVSVYSPQTHFLSLSNTFSHYHPV
jgi:hypothetical protein